MLGLCLDTRNSPLGWNSLRRSCRTSAKVHCEVNWWNGGFCRLMPPICMLTACTCRAVLGRFPMRAVSACRARARRRRYMRKTEAEYIQLEDVFLSEPLEGPHLFQLGAALESLSLDGVGVIPTDTQHAFVTAISSKTGTQRIYDIKGVATDQRKPLSLLCSDLSMASHYCDMTAIPRRWFQAMKSCLPGPYTFILRASAAVPRVVLEHKEIWEQDRSKLDFVVGVEALDAPNDLDRVSTVLDLTMEEPVLRRQGAGDVSIFEDVIEATVFQS
ncbi:unnamed protein product [Durusdinium trenchii]|uniref:Threonylcarbamoyl-AMP synthase n=1 Tax=Durusdinium trenchii TaxID=1381693 RepID=A0ABP0RJA3_9DINO